MSNRVTSGRVAPLLFGSGLCGLVYQIGWMRELRLVFGASTAASAAVLAIFIGGLGVGGLLLGKRADASARPLALYANLELVIAASAALSPLLLALVRMLYVGAGGSVALGTVGGTALRLVLAALVLAIPTLAMGGTLAAVTRAIETEGDARRRQLAVMYGINTLGAVVGALLATFFLIEILGNRRTIWCAALVNALLALIARSMARRSDEVVREPAETVAASATAPLPLILAASAIVGFAFFLMEMTWYRMLGPILGGTVFTFGLILAVALLGIGIGGLAYALRPAAKPATVRGLIATCLVQAICLAIPLALGDRIAVGAAALRSTSAFGFTGQLAGWGAICVIVVLPASIAAGVQFPLLVNLVGRGRANVGRHLGWVYATNTAGAIVGSLLGGFVLLPVIGAVGCWRLAIALLLVLAVTAVVATAKQRSRRELGVVAAGVVVAVALVVARGPTAAWRHSGIGAGRSGALATPADVTAFRHGANRMLAWESEGVESSVALVALDGLTFVVNGKIDGAVLGDAQTQMMGGLLGVAIHPAPRRAMVIGLGTGETAGWLADAPGIERVDAVELEPAILEVVRRCAEANRHMLENAKVHVQLGDAREVLLTSTATYDLVFSEPSNPYRAGVASLYTHELYEAVRDRLGTDGLFLQWTQSYEVDGATIATIYATLTSVFPEVHTWRLGQADLLFVASMTPIHYDAARIAERVANPAVREAMTYAWRVDGVEGLLSHFLGGTAMATAIAERAGGELNTDDKTLIEFAFARSLGVMTSQNVQPIRQIATALAADRPTVTGAVDWARFDELRAFTDSIARFPIQPTPALVGDRLQRVLARDAYLTGNLAGAAAAWKRQPAAPAAHFDALLVAEAFASQGEDAGIAALRPAEAAFVRARLDAARRRFAAAASSLAAGFTALRRDPFVDPGVIDRALSLVRQVAAADRSRAGQLAQALSLPFALYAAEERRIATQLHVAWIAGAPAFAAALAPIEPFVPWTRDVLVQRRDAYEALGSPLLEAARADLAAFAASQPIPLLGD